MATILLSAAGAALGSGFGGTVLGLSGAVIGRAVGATIGRVIDQRLLGAGSEPVETGRVERFRLMGASEGAAIAQIWGRTRIAGQVIWATQFQERTSTSGGGKGSPSPSVTSYSYSVSLAMALCEGEITRVGRIWADGLEIEPALLNLRVYPGSQSQLPDPKIEAVEGPNCAPSYRGIGYVVIEDLDLSRFGNRVPQFSFEVLRRAQGDAAEVELDLPDCVQAICMIPGTGEYAYATTPVHFNDGPGVNRSANVNTILGGTDFAASLTQLREELPQVGSVSLVVSWFGNDLRCGFCEVRPKVEQALQDGEGMPWRAGGVARSASAVVPQLHGLSVYGGTPSDASVIEAIKAIRNGGQEAMFYPFILMEQLAGNDLPDPYSGAVGQAVLPWRGRITTNAAPGQPGTSDRTAAAETEVAAFFGAAQPNDFTISEDLILYSGPDAWGYRRFVLHYAHLCAQAGGVDAFCIGSELRGLTQIRGAGDSFPVVTALVQLAAEVRAILGSATKITYAADWSEYFGYHTGNNVYFHLDPLWADANIDFVGIDNYAPIADWREGEVHADVSWGSTYNVDYLKANIAGGEGFDWYYQSPEGEAAQLRTPITDGAWGEPWVFRFKDLKSWWQSAHFNRIDGVRAVSNTAWVPQSKPFRFTEYGCAAIDKGANQPNKFLDPKSSESALPRASTGRRDDLIQMAYLRAMHEFWTNGVNNPSSVLTGDAMLDMARSHVWTWDARPFPAFPNLGSLWSDSDNYAHGHWLSGRSSSQPLARVIAEICDQAEIAAFEVTEAYGVVRGFSLNQIGSARSALQVLSLAYGIEIVERDGVLQFRRRDARVQRSLDPTYFALSADIDGTLETTRAANAETLGRVRISFVEAEGDFAVRTSEALFPDDSANVVSDNDLPLLLTASEARDMAERWLAEARVARDRARFALPPSASDLGAADTVQIGTLRYRIDRVEQGESFLIDAVRVEPGSYITGEEVVDRPIKRTYSAPLPVYPVFLDLPLLAGDEAAHSPSVAITAAPWPGSVAVWSSSSDDGYVVNRIIEQRAVIGVTESDLLPAPSGVWDRGPGLRVRMLAGDLASAEMDAVLNGANAAAIGDGVTDVWEVLQFAEAVLVAPATYDIRMRLRGQAGTDLAVPQQWPIGSRFVLLNNALQQIDLSLSARGLSRFYRIGDAKRSYDDPNVIVQERAFAGIGLRPYGVVHLRHLGAPGQDVSVSWIRRTRIDGDSWESTEVPLGEDREVYVVRVLQGVATLRETTVNAPQWIYTAAQQSADGAAAGFAVAVAQLSDRFGPGPFRSFIVL
jgi:hypothetical protein